jgi:serine/threonine protein kinase
MAAVDRIGRYRVTRLLGEGGMGRVYAAHDDRLDRTVAIKVIRSELVADKDARERFGREARAAARVAHPHICALYEFDESDGQPFLVMELLEGESLAACLKRGPLDLARTLAIAGPMLEALAALHRRGLVHGDLKPGNVFLSDTGVKLLDFGLARPFADGDTRTRTLSETGQGVLRGTPQYMAPEQLLGRPTDERADIFAAGAVVYEMLAGHPAFRGDTLLAVIHAVGYREPEPLSGPPEYRAIDAVLGRALIKDPAKRLARADELAALLREASHATEVVPVHLRAATRFVALPFRVLRPDPDTDFLAFSVPDAISSALADLESLIVRSPHATASGADVRAIGRDLAVDVVLTGTILRSGSLIRVAAQLTDAGVGTLIWSDAAQAPVDDLFQLQDALTSRIVESLKLPLTERDRRSLDRHAPASAEAYELYMRANQLMTESTQWNEARLLYERAVSIDPTYAPAWARLGQARRVLAKWGGAVREDLRSAAEAAFRRALELDPDLSLAHDLAAYIDIEVGRAPEAMERLLRRAATRPGDAGLFAGLVTTCRYAGLLEWSLAAHHRASAIDPARATNVAWTHFMLGDYRAAIAADRGSPPFCALHSRLILGDAGPDVGRRYEEQAGSTSILPALRAYRYVANGRFGDAMSDIESLRATGFDDPEGWYLYAFMFMRFGATEQALQLLARSVDRGYACLAPLRRETVWRSLEGQPAFDALVARIDEMVGAAAARFEAAGGAAVLR